MRRSIAFLSIASVLGITACQDSSNPVGVDPAVASLDLVASASGAEAEGLVFGPETFARGKRKRKTEVREFSIADFEGPFTLNLQNGDDRGRHKGTRARVVLNGVEIFGHDDFPDPKSEKGKSGKKKGKSGKKKSGKSGKSGRNSSKDLRRVEVDLPDPPTLSVLEVTVERGRGSFLQIWIEDSSQTLVSTDGGTFDLQDGAVTLSIPADALSEPIVLTAEPTTEVPPGTTALPGTVFDFGPDGTQFDEPIEITVPYDPKDIPAGVSEQSLRLFVLVDGIWEVLDGSVDTTAKTITGFTDHFSTFGTLNVVRFCSTDPSAFETFRKAYAAVIPGGTIEVCDGTHVVEGAVIDAPVNIQAEAGASPVLQTSVALSTFFLDGYAAGTVLLDGLTFDFSTPIPDGATRATLSYAIRGTGTYDQLILRNSTFNVDPLSRGSVFFWNNTVTGSGALVENTTFNGGQYGFSIFEAGPDTDLVVRTSQFSGTANRAILYSEASGRVDDSTFENCGSLACVHAINGSDVDVVANQFTGSELTGESVPDLNSLVQISSGSSALIDDNDMVGCGFFQCIGVFSASNVTTSNNRLTFVPDRLYDEANAMIRYENGSTGSIENNIIDGCDATCIEVNFGSNVGVRSNTITAYDAHGTRFGIIGFGGFDPNDPSSNPPTLVIEDNTIVGVGGTAGTDPDNPNAYAIKETGIQIENGTATAFRNSVTNAHRGLAAVNGGTFTDGSDNVVDLVLTGVESVNQSAATIHRSDFTNYRDPIQGEFAAGALTCNWWGVPSGPQGVAPEISSLVYTTFADTPIAGDATIVCDPTPALPAVVRVAAADDGSGLPFVATLAEAINLVADGGEVLVSDGVHSSQFTLISRPMTVQAEGPGVPVIDAGGQGAALIIGTAAGFAGVVTIDGLRFENAVNQGIGVEEQYDQVVIQNSQFFPSDVDGAGVSAFDDAQGNSLVIVNNVFTGGRFGVLLGNPLHVEVRGNDFIKQTSNALAGNLELFENNRVLGCLTNGCVFFGGRAGLTTTVRGNLVEVDLNDLEQSAVQIAFNFVGMDVAIVENNTIRGLGGVRNPADQNTWPLGAAIEVNDAVDATVSGNDISGVFTAMAFNQGLGSATITDNQVAAVFGIHDLNPNGTVYSIHRNDLVTQNKAFNGDDFGQGSLTCNWFGDALGPNENQIFDGTDPLIYTPYATVPIAGNPAVACTP